MKALAILGLIFGLAATGASVYGMVETRPNYDSNEKTAAETKAFIPGYNAELIKDTNYIQASK